jgi:hypothetical protein
MERKTLAVAIKRVECRHRQKRPETTQGAAMKKAKKKAAAKFKGPHPLNPAKRKRRAPKQVAVRNPGPLVSVTREDLHVTVPAAGLQLDAFTTLHNVTLPELWCRIEVPVHVTILENMRADSPVAESARKRPAALAQVLDLADGRKKKDLAIAPNLQALLDRTYKDSLVGRSFRITRHRRHERKNYLGYSVEEINPVASKFSTLDTAS